MKRIDTHQHLWDLEQLPYSWCAGIPALNRSFRLLDYLAAARTVEIVKTVFVEGDVDEPNALAEATQIQSLAESHPLIAGIVAGARPERPDFDQQLTALRRLPKLRGIRRVLHVVPDEISQSVLFVENLRKLEEYGLTFDLCLLARQLPLGMRLARECPGVQFVLDHCGVPNIKGKVFDPWRAQIAEMAALPNVVCKISGLVAYAGADWSVEELRPWVEPVVASFGWDRILWGGDWPVCTLAASLEQWAGATDQLFAAATEAQREKVFYKNAENIYRV